MKVLQFLEEFSEGKGARDLSIRALGVRGVLVRSVVYRVKFSYITNRERGREVRNTNATISGLLD